MKSSLKRDVAGASEKLAVHQTKWRQACVCACVWVCVCVGGL